MKIGEKYYRSVWYNDSDPGVIFVIDQELLPFRFEIRELRSVNDVYHAIKDMTVRGAPAIGVVAAFGTYLAVAASFSQPDPGQFRKEAAAFLISSRPTAVNLSWAVNKVLEKVNSSQTSILAKDSALIAAKEICETEIENCRKIGVNGHSLIEELYKKNPGRPVNILTHCNAGWLACVDYGTALAPVFAAHLKGIPVHLWVDETRPRNQGARLTTFELENCGIPFSLITDNTGGHLMQHGMVDLVLTGSDRTTRHGDVANKIGTYLKALAAFDNKVPFYVALPTSTIDMSIGNGLDEIEVEERDAEEINTVTGISGGKITTVRICPEKTHSVNYGFDITPARLVTGLITEKGICRATEKDIVKLFSENIS